MGSRFVFQRFIQPVYPEVVLCCVPPTWQGTQSKCVSLPCSQRGTSTRSVSWGNAVVETSALGFFVQKRCRPGWCRGIPLLPKPERWQAEQTLKMAAVKSSVLWDVELIPHSLTEMGRLESHLVGYLLYKWVLSLENNIKQRIWPIGGHCKIKRSLTKAYVLYSLLCTILSLSCQMHLTAIFYQPKLVSGFWKILPSDLLTLSAECWLHFPELT